MEWDLPDPDTPAVIKTALFLLESISAIYDNP
jgi:hypothetical protein